MGLKLLGEVTAVVCKAIAIPITTTPNIRVLTELLEQLSPTLATEGSPAPGAPLDPLRASWTPTPRAATPPHQAGSEHSKSTLSMKLQISLFQTNEMFLSVKNC